MQLTPAILRAMICGIVRITYIKNLHSETDPTCMCCIDFLRLDPRPSDLRQGIILLWQPGLVPSISLALSPAPSHPAVRSSCKRYTSSEARPLQTQRRLACQVLARAISIHSKVPRGSPMLSLGAELPAPKRLGAREAPGVCKRIIFP